MKRKYFFLFFLCLIMTDLRGCCSHHDGLCDDRKKCEDGFVPEKLGGTQELKAAQEIIKTLNNEQKKALTVRNVSQSFQAKDFEAIGGIVYDGDGTSMLDKDGNKVEIQIVADTIFTKNGSSIYLNGKAITLDSINNLNKDNFLDQYCNVIKEKKYGDARGLAITKTKQQEKERKIAFSSVSAFLQSEEYNKLKEQGNSVLLDFILEESVKQASQFYYEAGIDGDNVEKNIKKRALQIFADMVVVNPDKCLDNGDERTRRLTALPDGLTGAYGSQIVNPNNKSDTGNTDKLQHFAYAAKYSAQYGKNSADFLGKSYETVHSLNTNYDQKDIVANELGSEWAQSFMESGESISSFMNRKYIEVDGEYKVIDDYFNPNKN